MPTFCVGEMWMAYDSAGLFLITTSSSLTADGRLVMGAGIARQARDRFPGLDRRLGDLITQLCGPLGAYYLLISRHWPQAKLGCLQTKYAWQQPADLQLIARSVTALYWWATYHQETAVHLNYPGIGCGSLARAAVRPLLARLPQNIHIWRRPSA